MLNQLKTKKKFSEDVEITPELAKSFLEKNVKNRTIRPQHVTKLARDIERGDYIDTDDPIKFDINGNLIDGQHRLCAIIQADTPVVMRVTYNLEPKAQDVIDTGVRRSATDLLHLHGIPHAPIVNGMSRYLVAEAMGRGVKGIALTHSQVLELLELHPKMPLYAVGPGRAPNGISSVPLSVINYVGSVLLDRKDDAEQFMKVMMTGVPSYDGCPVHTLRERVLRLAIVQDKSRRVSHEDQYTLMKVAWNLLCKGEPNRKIYKPTGRVSFDGLKRSDILGESIEKFLVGRNPEAPAWNTYVKRNKTRIRA